MMANIQKYPKIKITPSRTVIAGWNGTVAGVKALALSLARNDAYGNANQALNEKCLPEPVTQENTFKEQNSFERMSECLGGICHA